MVCDEKDGVAGAFRRSVRKGGTAPEKKEAAPEERHSRSAFLRQTGSAPPSCAGIAALYFPYSLEFFLILLHYCAVSPFKDEVACSAAPILEEHAGFMAQERYIPEQFLHSGLHERAVFLQKFFSSALHVASACLQCFFICASISLMVFLRSSFI